MMDITTRSSTRVNPRFWFSFTAMFRHRESICSSSESAQIPFTKYTAHLLTTGFPLLYTFICSPATLFRAQADGCAEQMRGCGFPPISLALFAPYSAYGFSYGRIVEIRHLTA